MIIEIGLGFFSASKAPQQWSLSKECCEPDFDGSNGDLSGLAKSTMDVFTYLSLSPIFLPDSRVGKSFGNERYRESCN